MPIVSFCQGQGDKHEAHAEEVLAGHAGQLSALFRLWSAAVRGAAGAGGLATQHDRHRWSASGPVLPEHEHDRFGRFLNFHERVSR